MLCISQTPTVKHNILFGMAVYFMSAFSLYGQPKEYYVCHVLRNVLPDITETIIASYDVTVNDS